MSKVTGLPRVVSRIPGSRYCEQGKGTFRVSVYSGIMGRVLGLSGFVSRVQDFQGL